MSSQIEMKKERA